MSRAVCVPPLGAVLRLARRILVTATVTLVVIFVGLPWIRAVELSFDTARDALPVTRIVPTDLKDRSVSDAQGKMLSYFGYEFGIPWNDLDEKQTKLYPSMVVLRFRSGLRLGVISVAAREWTTGLGTELKVPRERIESSFKAISDYSFLKNLYEFTPDKMHYWAFSPQVHYREFFLLTMKTVALLPSAGTGIFNLQNLSYKGFQEGDPQARPDGIEIHLFSDEGSIEMIFSQKDYQNPAGVTQPEINRIVQSLRKAPHKGTSAGQDGRILTEKDKS